MKRPVCADDAYLRAPARVTPMTRRLAWLKDRHRGERCVLVANGPSLNRMDLGFLRFEHTLGLNKIYLGIERFHFYPRYYVAINAKVLQQAAHEIKHLNCVKFLAEQAARAAGVAGRRIDASGACRPSSFALFNGSGPWFARRLDGNPRGAADCLSPGIC